MLPLTPLSHLCVLLVALVGFYQTLFRLLADGGGSVRLHHFVGSVPEPPLQAVGFVELLDLL